MGDWKRQVRLTLSSVCLTALLFSGCGGEEVGAPLSAQVGAQVGQPSRREEQEEAKLPEETEYPEETNPAETTETPEKTEAPDLVKPSDGEDTPSNVIIAESGSEDVTSAGQTVLDEDGTYSSMEDVALYLHTYGDLPDNFITKSEARDLGWTGGGLEHYAPGMCIGGDRFGNYEGLLPDGTYHECDIGTLGATSRGAERLVWDEDGNIYYTADHYETFELIYAGAE